MLRIEWTCPGSKKTRGGSFTVLAILEYSFIKKKIKKKGEGFRLNSR